MERQVPVHNLGPNARESSPHEVLVIDTETLQIKGTDPVVQQLNLWVGKLVRRHGKNPRRPRETWGRGRTAEQLADFVEEQVKGQPTLWVYCHNLSFDLAVTRLPLQLMARGWRLGAHALATEAPWAFMAKGNYSIRLADSFSILPRPLGEIGDELGIGKLPLPSDGDSDAAWWARCERDVEITSQALVQAMDWWDENRLGCWSTTGPQTGWNMMRHLCVKQKGGPPIVHRGPAESGWTQRGDGHVTIHPDPVARVFERATLYQGRREAWVTGVRPEGTYTELDFRTAHLTVAAAFKLPCRRGVAFESLPLDTPYLEHPNLGIIAKAVIATDVPRYPFRAKGGICYPVGIFETVLAGPELAEAKARGELLAIRAGYFYRLSYHMQPWALYCESVLNAPRDQVPPAARIMVKAFTTRVFGKWCARTSRLRYEGKSPVSGWDAVHARDSRTHHPVTVLHIGGQMQEWIRDQEGDDSFPAVLSWVQSLVRVYLGRAVDAIGEKSMVAVSTDSLLVDLEALYAGGHLGAPAGDEMYDADLYAGFVARQLAGEVKPFDPRVKAVVPNVEVVTAQHVRVGKQRKYSGVPKGAKETRHNRFTFTTWPKLGGQIAAGDMRGFVQPQRRVDLTKACVNRYSAVDGCTGPVVARLSEWGGTQLIRPATGGCEAHGAPWSERQWPGLPALE